MTEPTQPPGVLIIAGNDPSGGAGVTADTQAVTTLGAHPACVITALTVQDTVNAHRVEAVSAGLVAEQARAVLADLEIRAIKIGLLASSDIGRAVAGVLADHPNIPVVLDPVLVAAGGAELAEDELVEVIQRKLLPLAALVTPNALEIRRLAGETGDRDSRAARLLAKGARYVLAKGGDEDTPGVENVLYGPGGFREASRWKRLPGQFHGSGCTLASAIAALLARGRPMPAAVAQAQRYVWESLETAYRPGTGQLVPRRNLRGWTGEGE